MASDGEEIELNDLEEQRTGESGSSATSSLFDGIDRAAGGGDDDFYSSPSFIEQYKQVVGFRRSKKLIVGGTMLAIVLLMSWLYILFSGFESMPIDHDWSTSRNTSTEALSTSLLSSVAGGSISSTSLSQERTKTLIPIKEYEIHKSRDPIPQETNPGDILTSDVQFIPSPISSELPKLEDNGIYLEKDNDNFIVRKLSDHAYENVIQKTAKFQHQNQEYIIESLVPNYQLTYAIVFTSKEKQFRHSYKSYCWLYDITKDEYIPILGDSPEEKLQHASWSPNFNYITFIQNNNLYIFNVSTRKVSQLTDDGSENIFNGKPDWVYEEEVLAKDNAFWWSPDELNLVYLKIDDTKVPLLNLEFYLNEDGQDSEGEYPRLNRIKYPKPGDHNPIVSVYQYNFEAERSSIIDRADSNLGIDFIVYDMCWIDNMNLIIKETDRESNKLNYRLVDFESNVSRITYTQNVLEDYNGWVESGLKILSIPRNQTVGRLTSGFIDILSNNGYNHLAYFPKADSNEPIFLTKGDWEVTTSPLKFDPFENVVYFGANRHSSFEQHIYSVDVESQQLSCLTVEDEVSFFDATFSPSSRFIILIKEGPQFPLMYKHDTLSKRVYMDFTGSQRSYHSIEIDTDDQGDPILVNLIEMRPDNFDENEIHPLLVNVYGGPGSQKTNTKFHITFEDTVADKLNTVVLYVDPRGTGGQGWKYRSCAKHNIGKYEGPDITRAVKKWIESRNYIDTSKTAIWGWSYGGFSTLKTLEYDKGDVFKYGMAVAPVTNWLLYDSIYTERYMGIPQVDKEGYEQSRISQYENFKKVNRFLIMHGTGDDNVHIENTFKLIDEFDLKGVLNYDMVVFPDSNHNINHHNAYEIVMRRLLNWVTRAFEGHYID